MTTRKTHDTLVTLGSSLEPEELYNPGHTAGTDTRDETVDPNDDRHDISATAHESLKEYVSDVSSGDASHQTLRRRNKGNTYQKMSQNIKIEISNKINFSKIEL